MSFIYADISDLEEIKNFYDFVIVYTKNMKNYTRWKKDVYPDTEIICGYIMRNELLILKDNKSIICAFALTDYQNEDYLPIKWQKQLENNQVSVVHILAVSPLLQNKGFAKSALEYAVATAKAKNKKAVRLDALATNVPAIKLYTDFGFKFCGTQKLHADNTGVTDFNYYEFLL